MTNTLSRNTLTLFIGSAGGALLSFALSVIIGRALGEDGLGIYATALAWVYPLWIIAEFGLGTLITREVARDPNAGPEYLRVTALARLGIGGGLMLALLLAAPLLTDDPRLVVGLQISAPLIVIGPFFSAFAAVFRARRVMWPLAVLNIGMLALQLALTFWVLYQGGDVQAALIVNLATSAGQLVAAGVWYGWQFRPDLLTSDVCLRVRTVLRQAGPFAIAAVLGALQLRVSVILLEQLAGAGMVGQYAAASRWVEAGRMLPQALYGALYPALAALSQNRPRLENLFRRVFWGLAAYGLLVGVGASLLSPVLIAWTFGAAFAPAADLLPVLIWSLLPGILKGSRVLYWYALGREQFVNRVTAVGLALQVLLSLLLIPRLGAAGVALTLMITETLVLAWLGRERS
jgi:O-antigen/teichoic acid export membrane protein